MFRKTLLYGLPVYLYFLEVFLKTLANLATPSVAGPTLAGAGIGFILPLTEFKRPELEKTLADGLAAAKAIAVNNKDKTFVDFVWLAFFGALATWMYSLFRTIRPLEAPSAYNPSLIAGCAVFVVSIVLTEIKERL